MNTDTEFCLYNHAARSEIKLRNMLRGRPALKWLQAVCYCIAARAARYSENQCDAFIVVMNKKYEFINISDYLLSNNHVNSIIVHKFDVSDEEVMAYYISFLKTLSLKLNNHTIHFFYNEVSLKSYSHIYPCIHVNYHNSFSYY